MRRTAPLALAAVIAACGAPAEGPPPGAEEARRQDPAAERAVREIGETYRGIRTYAAEVEADVVSRVAGEIDHRVTRGHLVAARPFKFRWEGTVPWRVVAVSDGETLWTYLPEIRQARARPAREVIGRFPRPPPGTDPTPSILLLPLVVRDDPFDVLSLGARARRMRDGALEVVWAEEETFGTAAPEAVTRYRRGEGGLVRWVEHEVSFSLGRGAASETPAARSPTSSRVQIVVRERHEAVVIDADLPDTAFTFELPAGVRVVKDFDPDEILRLGRAEAN